MRPTQITLYSVATLLACNFFATRAIADTSPAISDPALETSSFQAQTLPNDPNNPANFPTEEPPSETLDPEDVKNELGEIEIIKPQRQTPRSQPNVQLLLRSSAFSNSNITGSEFFNPGDTVFINSAQVLATPKLGEDTRLVATAGGGIVRYANESSFNYNYLNFGVAVQQRLAEGTYGQLGWTQDRLYKNENGDRLLLDDSIRVIVGRQDQLASRLRLDSFYELRASFADPSDQSRVANTLGARLRYDITPSLQTALDYRLSFKDYTQQDRFDTQHQLGFETIYNINPDLFIGGSVSYLFGSSSNSFVDLNNFAVGVNLGLNLPLF